MGGTILELAGCYRLYRREGVRTENGERSRVKVNSHESRKGIGDSPHSYRRNSRIPLTGMSLTFPNYKAHNWSFLPPGSTSRECHCGSTNTTIEFA